MFTCDVQQELEDWAGTSPDGSAGSCDPGGDRGIIARGERSAG